MVWCQSRWVRRCSKIRDVDRPVLRSCLGWSHRLMPCGMPYAQSDWDIIDPYQQYRQITIFLGKDLNVREVLMKSLLLPTFFYPRRKQQRYIPLGNMKKGLRMISNIWREKKQYRIFLPACSLQDRFTTYVSRTPEPDTRLKRTSDKVPVMRKWID